MEHKNKSITKWSIAVCCAFMVMISLGFGSSTKSLFPDEIAKYLNMDRSLVSLNESCRYIATAVVNIFFGTLISKYGAKKLVCAGFVSLVASMLLFAYADSIFTILVAGTLLGVGFSWTTTTMVGYIVNLWYPERKGTIMGIILASNGLGGAIAISLAGSFIDPETIGSYRNAYKMIACVFAVTLILLMIFFRDKNQETDNVCDKKSESVEKHCEGLEFCELWRKPFFILSLVCIFFSGFILQGTTGISAMHFKDVGIDYSAVKGILSFSSLLLAFSKFFTGYMYDKRGLRFSATSCCAFASLSAILLAVTKDNELGFSLAIAYSVISNFALPLETVMLPIYASDICGSRSYNKALGLYVSVNTAGYAASAPLMNICYDVFGSYDIALVASAVVMIIVLILLQYVISASNKEQKKYAIL